MNMTIQLNMTSTSYHFSHHKKIPISRLHPQPTHDTTPRWTHPAAPSVAHPKKHHRRWHRAWRTTHVTYRTPINFDIFRRIVGDHSATNPPTNRRSNGNGSEKTRTRFRESGQWRERDPVVGLLFFKMIRCVVPRSSPWPFALSVLLLCPCIWAGRRWPASFDPDDGLDPSLVGPLWDSSPSRKIWPETKMYFYNLKRGCFLFWKRKK